MHLTVLALPLTGQNLCFFSGNLSAFREAFFGYVEVIWREDSGIYYAKAAAFIVLCSGNEPILVLHCQIILFIGLTAAFFTGLEMRLFI